jgi:hypothetical protein
MQSAISNWAGAIFASMEMRLGKAMWKSVMLVSMLGTMVFGTLFVTSILNPAYVEGVAKEIIHREVEKSIHERIDALDSSFLTGKAAVLLKRQQTQIETARELLKTNLPELLATVIAGMQNQDCDCRRNIEKDIRIGIETYIAGIGEAKKKLTTLIQARYMDVAQKLVHEFRFFTGTNALVFVFLGIGAFFKRDAGIQLIPPALVLITSATIAGYLFLFSQNWLQTILFNDYAGSMYIAFMALVFAALCDIAFNRARITSFVLRAIGEVFANALQAIRC